MTKLNLAAIIILIGLASSSAWAKKKAPQIESFSGIIQSCYDGDTCRIEVSGKIQKIRFSGIDAPELKQEFGKAARDFLKESIAGKTVDLKCSGSSWDRKTCEVFLRGESINALMVQKGLAWDSPQYSKGRFAKDMELARQKKIGLWGKSLKLQSPYCYRKPTSKTCRKDRLAMESQ